MSAQDFTVLIVPGLREFVPDHWQTLLAERLPNARTVMPMGRGNLDLAARLELIELEAGAIDGPLIVVAHSAGVAMVVHWAMCTAREVAGALLAAPPDIERPMPEGYPTLDALRAGGWLPLPRTQLPFPSIVAASRNDPLAAFDRVTEMAHCWGGRVEDLGDAGHLNPASGHGDWRRADQLINELAASLHRTGDRV